MAEDRPWLVRIVTLARSRSASVQRIWATAFFVALVVGASATNALATPFNHLEFPTDIVFQVVLCRLRHKLSLRDRAELFLLRGFTFTHEAVREWEQRFAPLLAEQLRRKRQGKSASAGTST